MNEKADEIADASNKRCRNCASEIPTAARKCIHCDTWQNWRGMLDFSIPVLSLLLAILTVVFSSGKEFYDYITYTPNVDVSVAVPSYIHAPPTEYGKGPHILSITIVNNEAGNLIVIGALRCRGDSGSSIPRFARVSLEDPTKPELLLGDFVVPPKASQTESFEDVMMRGAQYSRVQRFWPGVHPCKVMYTYHGRRYEITKDVLTVDPILEEPKN